jgi:choline kinase
MGISTRAIILCAGNGKRLGNTTGPKALLEIGETTILERQVTALAAAGVDEVVLVVGYERQLVERRAESIARTHGVRFLFVENERWAETQTIWSMHLAAPYMEGHATFTLNGDVLFPRAVLPRLKEAGPKVALAIDEKRCGAEEVKVVLDGDDRLVEIHKGMEPARAAGEFIGIAWFHPDAGVCFRGALEDELGAHGASTYYDYALLRMSEQPAYGVRFRGTPMIEIDFPEDLARARGEIAPLVDAVDAAGGLTAPSLARRARR